MGVVEFKTNLFSRALGARVCRLEGEKMVQKQPKTTHFQYESKCLKSITDGGYTRLYYTPFGMVMKYEQSSGGVKGRSFSFTQYRYGFNNQEKDGELGDYYSFKYRIHDTRLGRFLIVHPLEGEYPWNSTYAFAENRVIHCIDLEGRESYNTTQIYQGSLTVISPNGKLKTFYGDFIQVMLMVPSDASLSVEAGKNNFIKIKGVAGAALEVMVDGYQYTYMYGHNNGKLTGNNIWSYSTMTNLWWIEMRKAEERNLANARAQPYYDFATVGSATVAGIGYVLAGGYSVLALAPGILASSSYLGGLCYEGSFAAAEFIGDAVITTSEVLQGYIATETFGWGYIAFQVSKSSLSQYIVAGGKPGDMDIVDIVSSPIPTGLGGGFIRANYDGSINKGFTSYIDGTNGFKAFSIDLVAEVSAAQLTSSIKSGLDPLLIPKDSKLVNSWFDLGAEISGQAASEVAKRKKNGNP